MRSFSRSVAIATLLILSPCTARSQGSSGTRGGPMNRVLFPALVAGPTATAACSDTERIIDPAPIVATGPGKSFGL